MAAPSKVEFPGKKKQRMRMRGTKQANADTQKRLRKNLDKLLEEGESLLPAMIWTGRLKWGRTDPVTKTLREMRRILSKRNDTKWLAKRMMAKRGDLVGKALAGSLMAAHDKEISLVGDYAHPSFGKGSFVRKGDGKPAYQAGIQNHHLPKLRMLPWEDHARRGYFFFSWPGGFVCTGRDSTIPEGWLESVLGRSRFDFTYDDGIWLTKGLEADAVRERRMTGKGYLVLNFSDGTPVALGLELLGSVKGKVSFIHNMALSMLPPNLSLVMTPEAVWYPEGYSQDGGEGTDEAIERVLNAWMGLTLNEGSIEQRVKVAVLHHLDHGIVVGDKWFEEPLDAVEELSGSAAEKELSLILMKMASGSGVRISQRGEVAEREGAALEIAANTFNDVLSALWEEYGLAGLEEYGLESVEADELWSQQMKKMRPFGKFLRELEDSRSKASIVSKFPYKPTKVPGVVGHIHDLVITGLTEGRGKAEKLAIASRGDIDKEASGWAWLVAAGRSGGQEWQFSPNARERGGAWSHAATLVWKEGELIVDGKDSNYKDALENLRKACGQSEPLP